MNSRSGPTVTTIVTAATRPSATAIGIPPKMTTQIANRIVTVNIPAYPFRHAASERQHSNANELRLASYAQLQPIQPRCSTFHHPVPHVTLCKLAPFVHGKTPPLAGLLRFRSSPFEQYNLPHLLARRHAQPPQRSLLPH